jgi:hypothetical protein
MSGLPGSSAAKEPTRRGQRLGLVEKQYEHRVHGLEILAQAGFHRIHRFQQAVRLDEALTEPMNPVREGIIGAGHVHQFLQLALQGLIPFAQDFHLTFDQTHGGAGIAQMRQAQFGEQCAVPFEKIWIGL